MSETHKSSRVSILVKALPQRSANHGETVCCAGVTAHGEFKNAECKTVLVRFGDLLPPEGK